MEFTKPRNKSSKVWKYFGQRVVNGALLNKDEVVCLVCYNTYRTCGSTSPMFSHLMKMHPNEYSQINNTVMCQRVNSSLSMPVLNQVESISASEINSQFKDSSSSSTGLNSVFETCMKSSEQPVIQASSTQMKMYDQTDSRQQEITNLLVDVMVENMLPFSFANSVCFRKLMTRLDPQYIVPDKKTISKVIITNRFDEQKESLKEKVSRLSSVSLTFSQWHTNGCRYLMYGAHSITETWSQTHCMLDVLHVPESTYGPELAKTIRENLDQWLNEDASIVAITADRQAHTMEAISNLGRTYLPCLADVIHEAVIAEVFENKNVKPVVDKCRAIAPLLHHSNSVRLSLMSGQLRLGYETPISCPVVSETRWNSIYSLFSFMSEHVSLINEALSTHGYEELVLDDSDQACFSMSCSILHPLAEATDLLAAERYVTSSTVMPFLDILKTAILTVRSDDMPQVTELKTSLTKYIADIFAVPERQDLLLQCSFVDPRFKDLNFISNEQKRRVRDLVYARAKDTGVTPGLFVNQPPAKKPRSSLGQLFSVLGKKDLSSSTDLYDPLDEEISAYVNNECTTEIDGDPLTWWSNRKTMYPALGKVASQLLSIPATSAPSDYCFKKVGDLLMKKKSTLSPKTMQMMTFLHENMK